MMIGPADQARGAGIAYHLVPVEVWTRQRAQAEYLPEAYESDGFIHCTNGLDQLLQVANWFYTGDTRPFLVLVLDVSKLSSPVRYDDDEQLFPHIYGPLNTNAVNGTLQVVRADDGSFVRFVAEE